MIYVFFFIRLTFIYEINSKTNNENFETSSNYHFKKIIKRTKDVKIRPIEVSVLSIKKSFKKLISFFFFKINLDELKSADEKMNFLISKILIYEKKKQKYN